MAKCKECGGNNAKKLSVINKTGTTDTRMGGVILGAGNVRTSSVEAKNARYRVEDEGGTFLQGVGCLVSIVGGGLVFYLVTLLPVIGNWFYTSENAGTFLLIFSIILIFVLWQFLPFMQNSAEKNSKKREIWNKTWRCLDCGHQWVGSK